MLLTVISLAQLWKRLTAVYLGNITSSKGEVSLPEQQLMTL